jgi:hypothetical protein
VFLARDLTPVATRPEDHEVLEPRWVAFDEALALASSGRLEDGKTLIGLIWAGEARRAGSAPFVSGIV